MKYKNGRAVVVNDRTVVPGVAGKYIGTVVAVEGNQLRVMPLHSQQAFYVDANTALHIDDALVPDADVKAVA